MKRACKPGVSQLKQPRHPRYNVAFAIDWQGDDDTALTVLFAGAEMQWLVSIFTSLCATQGGVARGFRIESQMPPTWRNGFVNDRLAVILEDRNADMLKEESLMLIIKRMLQRYVNGGHVDCYALDDFLNLSVRRPESIIDPQPVAAAVIPEGKKKQNKRRNN